MALNAWRQLGLTNDALGKSLEKLSSGYRINRAADDPAGLVLSENLRGQIVGMDQALANTQDGISMIQTAEGAMTEMHSLLDSMRSLALHAANTAAVTPEAIAADQEQLDSAIDSIDRIATTTAYAGKKLLDGTAGMQAQIKNSTIVQSVQLGNTVPAGAEGEVTYIHVTVSAAATQAELGSGIGASFTTATDTLGSAATINLQGIEVSFLSGDTMNDIVTKINDAMVDNNIDVRAGIDGNSGSFYIDVHTTDYGSDAQVDLYDPNNVIISSTRAVDNGTDIKGTFTYSGVGGDWAGTTNTVSATGDGLTLTVNDGEDFAGFKMTLTEAGNATTGAQSNVARIFGAPLTFQVGANAGETYNASIGNMRAAKLGASVVTNGLNALKDGQTYDLATNAQTAIDVIDQAIKDVSTQRAKLGAIQANVLESNQRNLGVARENMQASESRIRDVDMAQEMMEFTKNQILTQAATAMLAQANAVPQGVLQLLR